MVFFFTQTFFKIRCSFTWLRACLHEKRVPLRDRGTLPCRVNDTGILNEMFSQGGSALSLRAKSKQLKELSLSSEAHDANKDLLLSLESMKTSLVSFFLPWCCVVVRLHVLVVVFAPPRSLSAISFSRSLKDRSSFSSSPVTSTITSSLVVCLFAVPWSWCLRKTRQVCRLKPPCWKENRNFKTRYSPSPKG